MNMIEYLKKLKSKLKEKDIPEEEMEKAVQMVQPLYEFYDYMEKHHNKKKDDINSEIEDFFKTKMDDYKQKLQDIPENESKLKYLVEMNGEITSDYSKKYNYKKYEELKKSINSLMELNLKNYFDN